MWTDVELEIGLFFLTWSSFDITRVNDNKNNFDKSKNTKPGFTLSHVIFCRVSTGIEKINIDESTGVD